MSMNRIMTLAGKNPRQELLDKLTADRARVDESYSNTISRVKNGQQIDEGIFAALKNAFGTAAELGKMGADKVKEKASKLAASVKEVYKTAKARAELKNLVAGLKKIIGEFEELSTESPTIIKADAEVKKELDLFKDVFANTIATLSSRMAVQEGIENNEAAIKYMLVELGVIDEPAVSLTEASESEELRKIFAMSSFKEAEKRMKFVSSRTQLNNGTLVFDTGMNGITWKGEEDPKSTYLLKIYADGQVRAELKGGKNYAGITGSHYRLGKPISGKTSIEMYDKALADIVKRYEKKKARYGKEKDIIAKRHQEWQDTLNAANAGSDAELEEI